MQKRNNLPPALQGLAALNLHDSLDMRPVLLRVMTDLFAASAAPREEDCAEFAEMAISMLGDVDATTLAAVARTLSTTRFAPAALVDRLLLLGGDAAETLLSQQADMSPERLTALVEEGPLSLVSLIAQRNDLDAATVRGLVERPEQEILLALLKNETVTFDRRTISALIPRARRDAELARMVAAKAPSAEDAAPLFLFCEPTVRAEILRRARVADVLASRRDDGFSVDDQTARRIESLALSGDRVGLRNYLAQATMFAPDEIERLLTDPTGEAIAVLFAALGVTAPLAGRIFLLASLCPPLSVHAVHDLVSIVASLSQRAAQRLVSAMCGGAIELRRPTSHATYLSPTASPTPSREAAVDLRNTSAERRRAADGPRAGLNIRKGGESA